METQVRDRVRVAYRHSPAVDDRDAPVPVHCTPRVVPAGERTLVTCTATDHSGSSAKADFTVDVRVAGR
jgi:hypothetical protein